MGNGGLWQKDQGWQKIWTAYTKMKNRNLRGNNENSQTLKSEIFLKITF